MKKYGIPSTSSDHQVCIAAGLGEVSKSSRKRAIVRAADRAREEAGSRSIPGWDRIRQSVFARDGRVCGYCRSPVECEPHCDHIHPYILGGSSEMWNLVTACPTCNTSKSGDVLSHDAFAKVMSFIGISGDTVDEIRARNGSAAPRTTESGSTAQDPDSQYIPKGEMLRMINKAKRVVKRHYGITHTSKDCEICKIIGSAAHSKHDKKMAIIAEADRIQIGAATRSDCGQVISTPCQG